MLAVEFNVFNFLGGSSIDKSLLFWIKVLLIPTTFGILSTTIFYFFFENHAAEKSLEKSNELLAAMNVNLKDAQEQLVHASKMAALGEMAGGVAHEINSPLAAIKTFYSQIQEVMDDEPLDKELIKKLASKAESTIDRMSKIIFGLRSFSRDGSMDPFQRVHVHQLIEETLSFCNELFKNEGIQFTVEYGGEKEEIVIEARPIEISQVLLNLLNNSRDAIRSSEKKWIKLAVSNERTRVELRVIDCGLGIPKGIREKLFDPFFTTKDIGKGTGMGLSISSSIVQSHQGELRLDPQFKNTCFVMSLPKKQVSNADALLAGSSVKKDTEWKI
jgi:C4-dicarboxylate-specific signal transduction histidine kinase